MNDFARVLIGSHNCNAMTIRERFDTNWMPEPFSGCHLWTSWMDSNGHYAAMSKRGGASTKSFIAAHRVSYALHNGPIPKGMFVLHRCDTKSCVNPNHLFLGRQTDNMRDCIAKGRFNRARGEKVGLAVLTESAVRTIRASNAKWSELAKQFGVSESTIHSVRTRRTWKHVV